MLAFFAFFSAVGDFGLYSIATREISRKNAKEETILSKIFTLRLIISLTIFTLTTVFVWFLPYEIPETPDNRLPKPGCYFQ